MSNPVSGYLNVSALSSAALPAAESMAITANRTSTSANLDGQGGTYYYVGSAGSYTPNHFSVVSASAVDNWLMVNSYGPPVNVLAFGADPTGSTNSYIAFRAALATKKCVFVPPGKYSLGFITPPLPLLIQYPGQVLYGPQPNGAGGATLIFSGSLSGLPQLLNCCIYMADTPNTSTGSASNSLDWPGLRDIALDCSAITDPNNIAVIINQGLHATLDNVYIHQPQNGVLVYTANTTLLNRLTIDAVQSVYGIKTSGYTTNSGTTSSTAQNNEVLVLFDCEVTGTPFYHTVTGGGMSGSTALTVSSTAGVSSGMLVGGHASFLPGTTVTPSGGTTVELSLPLNGTITSGSNMFFGQAGYWLDTYMTTVEGLSLRTSNVVTGLYITDSDPAAKSPPTDMWLHNLHGSAFAGDAVVNNAGIFCWLVNPTIRGYPSATTRGGRGIYFGSNFASGSGAATARNMTVIGGGITEQQYNGIEVAGSGFLLEGTIVSQNSQAESGGYDGVYISSGAVRVRIIGNQIGAVGTSSGQQRYAINGADATAGEVIVTGNDLRGNSYTSPSVPVLGVSQMTMGTNQGVTNGGYSTSLASGTSVVSLTATDTYVGITNTHGSAVTVTLPGPPTLNQIIEVKDEGGTAGTHTITISPTSGYIDGATSYPISTSYGSVKIRWNGSNWFTIR